MLFARLSATFIMCVINMMVLRMPMILYCHDPHCMVYKIQLIHAIMLPVSCHWNSVITIIKTTSEVGDGDGMCDWLAGDGGRGPSGRGRHT